MPHSTPVIIDGGDLRIDRSPVMPRPIEWDADGISAYGRNYALLTRCSTRDVMRGAAPGCPASSRLHPWSRMQGQTNRPSV